VRVQTHATIAADAVLSVCVLHTSVQYGCQLAAPRTACRLERAFASHFIEHSQHKQKKKREQ